MSNEDEFKLEFPPFSPDGEESWDDYKKKVRNKFGNKYDTALNLFEEGGAAFADLMEANIAALPHLSPEKQFKFLRRKDYDIAYQTGKLNKCNDCKEPLTYLQDNKWKCNSLTSNCKMSSKIIFLNNPNDLPRGSLLNNKIYKSCETCRKTLIPRGSHKRVCLSTNCEMYDIEICFNNLGEKFSTEGWFN